MLKGKTEIKLTNVNTGEVEIYEEENIVTKAVQHILNDNIFGSLYSCNSGAWFLTPLVNFLINGIRLYGASITADENNYISPTDNIEVGYASNEVNSGTNNKYGSRNLIESKEIKNGYKFVWDFATSQCNGHIANVSLTSVYFGKNSRSLVCISNTRKTLSSNMTFHVYRHPSSERYDSTSSSYAWKIFLDKQFILCVSSTDKNTVEIRKIHIKPFTNGCTVGGITFDFNGPNVEIQTIKTSHILGYQVEYINHKTKENWVGSDSYYVRNQFCIDNDGTIYAVDTYKIYDYEGTENVKSSYFENYLITIKDGVCTEQKLPFSTSYVCRGYSRGGKYNNKLYFSPEYYYNPTSCYCFDLTNNTFSRDSKYANVNANITDFFVDENKVAIDKNGKKRNINLDSLSGYLCAAHYHNYFIALECSNESSWPGSGFFHFDLYLDPTYLATINNLSKPIDKTDQQTMKITYTLTEVE